MKTLATFIILGCMLAAGIPSVSAAPPSDWPSLNADASQSNYNPTEKTITAGNFLKLSVKKWQSAVLLPNASYPIVAGGRVYVPILSKGKIHARAIDAASGKQVASYSKDAFGGLLYYSNALYLAGKKLQAVDPTSGDRLALIQPPPSTGSTTFINPQVDGNIILVGHVPLSNSKDVKTSILAVDPDSHQIVRTLPSTSASGATLTGRVITTTTLGSVIYDESTGRTVARPPYRGSNWFAGASLAYTVATLPKHNAALYAFNNSGKKVWSHIVGPPLATQSADWPHAVTPDRLIVQMLKPQDGIEALDPATGKVVWTRPMRDVVNIVAANNVAFILTYGLGQPVQLVGVQVQTGKLIGAIRLSSGYFAFGAQNGLMVADGMVFIRVVGPAGPQLIGLGL